MMKHLILILSIICLSSPAHGELTSSAFLKIGAGARSAALGGAYTAASIGPDAVYWNPAALTAADKPSVTLTHAMLYDEVSHDFASFATKGLGGNIGAALTWLDYGNLNGRDINGLSSGDFSANDIALSLAYAREYDKTLSLGLAGKYIHSKIAGDKGDGFALDGGLMWLTPVEHLKAGLAVQNLGPEFRFSGDKRPLPLTWSVGTSYSGIKRLAISLDGRTRPKDGDDELCLGVEYKAADILALRTGYNSKAAKAGRSSDTKGLNALDNLRGLSAGFGVEVAGFTADYAFTPYGELGNAQRITLSARF